MRSEPALELDALIIGGGPAGSACANRLARGGARVAIVEATDFSAFRIGEVIDPSARPYLTSLGVGALEGQRWASYCSGVAANWGNAAGTSGLPMLGLHGGSCRVERNLFDKTLFEHAEQAGAKGFTRCRIASLRMNEGKWNFDLQSDRDAIKGRASWVVAATGRNRRAPGARSQSRRWLDRLIAISMTSDGEDPASHLSQDALHLQAASSGWWYSVTTPSGRIVVVFLTDSDLLPRGKRTQSEFMLTQLSQVALPARATRAAATCLERCGWIGFGARSGVRTIGMSKNWIAAGDALAAHDPLCGKGIAYALGSGIETADLLLGSGSDVDMGRRSQWADRVARSFNAYAVERLASYGLERKFATSTFWQRRLLDHSAGGHLAQGRGFR